MFGLSVKVENKLQKVEQAAEKAAFKNFGHAAASIRKDAIASIKDAPTGDRGRDSRGRFTKAKRIDAGSPPGTPPYTHGKGKRGRRIKKAILYAADKEGAVIGTAYSKFGTAGSPHEHGGSYKGQIFAERPFMFPALLRQAGRFAGSFAGSIGQ